MNDNTTVKDNQRELGKFLVDYFMIDKGFYNYLTVRYPHWMRDDLFKMRNKILTANGKVCYEDHIRRLKEADKLEV